MAITHNSKRYRSSRGFALFVAVIFMSVMLTFGLALGSIGYKQQIIASSATESQNAFYAADAALECALYADQKLNLFAFAVPQPNPTPAMDCDGVAAIAGVASYDANPPASWVVTQRVSIDEGALCADVTIYKSDPNSVPAQRTFLFSRGYNVPCGVVDAPGARRFTARGLNASYQ